MLFVSVKLSLYYNYTKDSFVKDEKNSYIKKKEN